MKSVRNENRATYQINYSIIIHYYLVKSPFLIIQISIRSEPLILADWTDSLWLSRAWT